MVGKFSFFSLLNDFLKKSEIQEEVEANKVIIVYVLEIFPPKQSNCYIKHSGINNLLKQKIDFSCSTIHYGNIYFTQGICITCF